MPYTMDYVYVLKGTYYCNWSETEDGPEVHDEDTHCALVSAHSAPGKAAEAAIEYIEAYEPNEEDMDGPLESLWLWRVALDPEDPTNAASSPVFLGACSDDDARREIREKVRKAFG